MTVHLALGVIKMEHRFAVKNKEDENNVNVSMNEQLGIDSDRSPLLVPIMDDVVQLT